MPRRGKRTPATRDDDTGGRAVVDIRAVARASGFSVATVSRALNGRPEVSAATRALVADTAQQLGYLPNQQARTLVRRRSDTVGLIWDSSYIATKGRQPFLQDLLVGLKLALAQTGYHLMLLSPEGTDRAADAFVRIAMQHSLDGVALMAADEHLPAVNALIASGRPCVGLDLPIHGHRATYVSSDNRAGAALAVRHLYELGHRRIATITGPVEMLPATARLEGYCATMSDLGLAVPENYIAHGDFFLPSGHEAMRHLLALSERPTAVFVAGDEMAIGAVHAITDAGLGVPGDISVVGYDDIEVAALVRPALTTVTQDYLAMGRAAVDLLTEMIAAGPLTSDAAGQPPLVTPRLLPGQLIVRDSSGPVVTLPKARQ